MKEINEMSKRRVTNSPVKVQILLTRKCNLSCIYCSETQFKKNEKEPELNTNEWINLLRRLKEIQVFDIYFSGGEIFLREDIFKILEAAVECKFPKISISTNGTLINDAVAKRLKDLNLKDITVSLDGDEETNSELRGPGSFRKTIKGIKNLINNGITPEILFTPLKNNTKNLEETVDVLYPLGIRELSFNELHPTGRSKKIFKEIMLNCFTDSEDFRNLIENIRRKYNEFKIEDHHLGYQCYPDRYRYVDKSTLKNKEKPKLKPCSACHSSCNITSSGWVLPCSELIDFKGGNIREKDILDIWRSSENFDKIRRLSDISVDQIPYCRNCDYNILCNAGCRADAYAVYGDLIAPDPFCPYWKVK